MNSVVKRAIFFNLVTAKYMEKVLNMRKHHHTCSEKILPVPNGPVQYFKVLLYDEIETDKQIHS